MDVDVSDDFESQYAEELKLMNEESGIKCPPIILSLLLLVCLLPGVAAGPPSRRCLDLRSPPMETTSVSSRKRPLSAESPLPVETSVAGRYLY